LGTAAAYRVFEWELEAARLCYAFGVAGYVLIPEHMHLLVSEPLRGALARVLQAPSFPLPRTEVRRFGGQGSNSVAMSSN